MGRVFLGTTPGGRAVAVKLVHPELAADPAFLARFRAEVAAASRVSGAYTAPVVAAGPDDNPPWMATVLVAGPSLAEAVAAAGPLPPEVVWRLAAGLTEALAAIHARGLIHRDLKPSNIILADDGPQVIDFGISRALDGTALTATGLIVGTPAFMSPEQAEGLSAHPAGDVFSLGAVLAFAACGTGPFGDGRPVEVLYRVVHSEPALETVPTGLRPLVAACLAKDPAARPTLPELAEAVAAGRPASPGNPLGLFWPETVNQLIRLRQEQLRAASSAAVKAAPPVVYAEGLARPQTRPQTWLTRRRALLGAAGTGAAGLAVAGWVLSQGKGASHLAGHTLPHAKVSPRDTPRPRVTGPPAWLARLSPGRKIWVAPDGAGSGQFVSGGIVYASDLLGSTLYALGADTGKTLWTRAVKPFFLTLTATPESVFLTDSNSALHALSAAHGAALWSGRVGGAVSPQGPVAAGNRVYVACTDDSVYALNAITGTARWRALLDGMPAGDLAVADGTVFTTDVSGIVYALSTSSGARLWTTSIKGPATPSDASVVPTTPPVVSDGVVYIGSADNLVYALRAADSKKLWAAEIGGGADSDLTVAGGVLYLAGKDRHLYAVRTSARGAVLWRIPMPGRGVPMNLNPVVADGTIYVASSDRRVYAVRAADGSALWSTGTGGGAAGPMEAAGGILYISGNDRRLYAVRG